MLKKLFTTNRKRRAAADAPPETSLPNSGGPQLHIRQQLHQLNLDFLRLLQAAQPYRSERWAKQLGLDDALNGLLQQCDNAQLTRISTCDFAVFSAAFAEPASWQRLAQLSLRIAPEDRYAALLPGTDTPLQRTCINLCQSVLFFAWHLSKQEPHWARVLLGMSNDALEIISTLDIWQCQYIAHQHCNVLQPRWHHSPRFWQDLLHYGLTGNAEHERMLLTISRQLTARELEPSAIMRLCGEEPESAPAPPVL